MNNELHTRKEKQLINDLWSKLHYCCDCTSNAYRLNEAYKYERKERKNGYTAKALILGQVAELYLNNPTARELRGISQGIFLGGFIGLDALIRVSDYPNFHIDINKLVEDIKSMREIHSKAVTRRVDSIMSDYKHAGV